MPELPEVETLRRGLERRVAGRTITGGRVLVPKMVKGSVADPDEFVARITGSRIVSIDRRGKHLIFSLDSGYYLLLHLKMRGQVVVVPLSKPVDKYLAVVLEIDGSDEMRFHDMWTWGEIRFLDSVELAAHPALAAMGAEPLSESFTAPVFGASLRKRARTTIKAALLDQSIVAGVGNIYADESLFRSRIRPTRIINSLSDGDVERLRVQIRAVLEAAIGDGGTLSDNYVDADGLAGRYTPQVYDRGGKPCVHCGAELERLRVAGRGTVFCPVCQG